MLADVPSDHSSGIGPPFRVSNAQATDIAAMVAFLKTKTQVPVWLIGTSASTISAANGAVRLGPSQLAGIVLTSTVWSRMGEVPIDQIAVPTLIVHNRNDGCEHSPFSGAETAMTQLAKAPVKELIAVSGGQSPNRGGNPCGEKSPHGYYGIEDSVVPAIVKWIKEHKPAS